MDDRWLRRLRSEDEEEKDSEVWQEASGTGKDNSSEEEAGGDLCSRWINETTEAHPDQLAALQSHARDIK